LPRADQWLRELSVTCNAPPIDQMNSQRFRQDNSQRAYDRFEEGLAVALGVAFSNDRPASYSKG
jgi:hypothetical protein